MLPFPLSDCLAVVYNVTAFNLLLVYTQSAFRLVDYVASIALAFTAFLAANGTFWLFAGCFKGLLSSGLRPFKGNYWDLGLLFFKGPFLVACLKGFDRTIVPKSILL